MTTATTTTPADDTAVTLAEYERLAIGTGEYGGADAVLFSSGKTEHWTPAWGRDALPAFARATVYRVVNGHRVGIEVVCAWDESAPEGDELTGWEAKPQTRFGGYALRRAYQRAFADVIERPKPAEAAPKLTAAEAGVKLDAINDAALLVPEERRKLVPELDALYAEATAARVIDPHLAAAFHLTRAALLAPLPAAKPAGPRPVPAPPRVRPEDTVRRPRRKPEAAGK